MWFDGITTNRSTLVPAFGSVAVMAQETDSTVKRNVKKSAFRAEQACDPHSRSAAQRRTLKEGGAGGTAVLAKIILCSLIKFL